jgi:hypothetical protein
VLSVTLRIKGSILYSYLVEKKNRSLRIEVRINVVSFRIYFSMIEIISQKEKVESCYFNEIVLFLIQVGYDHNLSFFEERCRLKKSHEIVSPC